MEKNRKMSLVLMYITNNPQVALIAEKYGVDRIWIDLEDKKNGDKFSFLLFFSYLCISKAVLRLVAGIPLLACERKVRAA